MEIPKELEEMIFEDPAVEMGITPSKLDGMGWRESIKKTEELYLEFEKRNDKKKINGIFSRYPNIRSIAVVARRILSVSEKPEGFSNDYLKCLGHEAKSIVYSFHGNDLCEEASLFYPETFSIPVASFVG
ncbi:hypothetical protein HYT26_04660 [Candidatus Pacearchaeota archaeon]|nr:hypothetical protein [Candidatus Pacearchaeota archaeon]